MSIYLINNFHNMHDFHSPYKWKYPLSFKLEILQNLANYVKVY
jgi:hypothetical protein